MTSLHAIVLLMLAITPSADCRRFDALDEFTAKTGAIDAASTCSLTLLSNYPSAVDPRREVSDEEAYEEECDFDLDVDVTRCLGDSILQWSTIRISWPPLGALGLYFSIHGDCRVSPLRC